MAAWTGESVIETALWTRSAFDRAPPF